ncbi:FadR/GntR family transcriptional regulator [Diplocloster agilis]|uniref:FCD domain-containing protein n=1 Tax=Diplocloster agilis TaxID=2850323 RepID=A0A949K085_9FIRM|nr:MULTISPECIES: FCD domain-containing protein [Lachnospiraceae]MBU9737334.1 FCD domain-containing protein [Diplocloster agilis]MCU6732572.1 FCD domain-containing protein [Suonthocola fibrivorans]SCI53422.1 Pyruvate dehydrogenase complex repressor [uncultured Clostridium sp.]
MPKQTDLNEKLCELILKSVETGEKLPTEKEMMDTLGVSRAVLRDALSVYETSGVIVSRQGSGRYAQMPNIGSQIINIWSIFIRSNPSLLLELLEIRSILETYSLPKVINKITIEQLQALNVQVNEMKRKVTLGQTFEKNDREFHRILFSSTENSLLEQLLSAFWDLYDAAKVSSFREDLYILANQHQDILDAIMRKDLELSTQLMRAQFEDAEYQIITSLMK